MHLDAPTGHRVIHEGLQTNQSISFHHGQSASISRISFCFVWLIPGFWVILFAPVKVVAEKPSYDVLGLQFANKHLLAGSTHSVPPSDLVYVREWKSSLRKARDAKGTRKGRGNDKDVAKHSEHTQRQSEPSKYAHNKSFRGITTTTDNRLPNQTDRVHNHNHTHTTVTITNKRSALNDSHK